MKGRMKITKSLILLIIVILVFSVSLFLTFNQQPLNQNTLTIPTQPISPTSSTNSKVGTHLQYLMQTSDPSAECEMIIFFEKTVNYTQGISLLKELGDYEIISNYTIINGICVKAPIGMAETIAQQNYVRSVTYNEKIELSPDQITTDGIHAKDTDVNDVIGASTLQTAYGLNGTGVVVAVIDTGINPHNDLPGSRIIYNESFVDGEGYTDYAGHGTAVAGIIGASGGTTAKGVAPNVTFLNLKVLDAGGYGTLDWILQGINEAVRNTSHPKADIISMSLGAIYGSSYDDLSKAVNSAWINNDTIVVVAAGNEGGRWYGSTYYGPNYGTIRSPGLAANIITVGATGGLDQYSINYSSIAYFSSRGPADDGRAKPDIVAPGRDLTTLDNDGSSYWISSFSGTSASTPVVSGAIALLLDDNSNISWISPNTVKAAIMMNAEDLGDNPFAQGAGQINISRAYNYLQDYYIYKNDTKPPLIITPIRALAFPMLLWDLFPAGLVLTIVVGNVTSPPIINASFSVSGNARAFTAVYSGGFPSLNDTQEFVLVTFVVPLGGSVHSFSGNLRLVNGSGDTLFNIPLELYDASFIDWPVSISLWFLILNNLNSVSNTNNLIYSGIGLVALGSVAAVGLVLAALGTRKLEALRKLDIYNELLQLSTMVVNYCPYCGTEAGAKDFFCYNCGKQIRIPSPQPYNPK